MLQLKKQQIQIIMKTKIKNTYNTIIKKFFNSPSEKFISTLSLSLIAIILLGFYLSPEIIIIAFSHTLLKIIDVFIFLSIIVGMFLAGIAITIAVIIIFNFIGNCIAEKVVDEINTRRIIKTIKELDELEKQNQE
jgi:hypothetical protein